jgi:hypothetical protein
MRPTDRANAVLKWRQELDNSNQAKIREWGLQVSAGPSSCCTDAALWAVSGLMVADAAGEHQHGATSGEGASCTESALREQCGCEGGQGDVESPRQAGELSRTTIARTVWARLAD